MIRQKSKLLAIIVLCLSAMMIFASCEKDKKPVTKDPGSSGQETNGGNELRIYDNAEDVSGIDEFGIDFKGEYKTLSKKATKSVTTGSPASGMYEVGNNLVVVHIEAQDENTLVVLIKIDKETGKQVEKLTQVIPTKIAGVVDYIEFMGGKEGYGENDLLVNTQFGSYIFDLADLSKEPVATMIGENFKPETLSIDYDDDTTYDLSHFQIDYDAKAGKIAVCQNDGVYISDANGNDAQKIVPQPDDRNWYETLTKEDEDMIDTIGDTQIAKYIMPRFMDGGKKIVCNIISYALPSIEREVVGIAVIDVASRTVETYSLYTKESEILKNTELWDVMQEVHTVNYFKKIDEETVGVMVTGMANVNGKSTGCRYDIYISLTDGKVKGVMSQTGITKDYHTLAVNDVYKGTTAKITFYNMDTGEYLQDGVYITDQTTAAPLAISDHYAIFEVSKIGEDKKTVVIVDVATK